MAADQVAQDDMDSFFGSKFAFMQKVKMREDRQVFTGWTELQRYVDNVHAFPPNHHQRVHTHILSKELI